MRNGEEVAEALSCLSSMRMLTWIAAPEVVCPRAKIRGRRVGSKCMFAVWLNEDVESEL